ncbi:MAG: hypothetical protein V1882_12035 [Candidatus Omnitrophota bacterium]
MNDSRSTHASEDWGVVLQSVPSKNKREIVKRLEEIFEVEKRDAEQILSNMPLILVDNLSFGLAARIKKFFQTLGAVAETTNHDMIKKNCFQIVWPQTPDLSFFMKNETGPSEAPAQDKKEKTKGGIFQFPGKKTVSHETKPEEPKVRETPKSEESRVPEVPKAVVLDKDVPPVLPNIQAPFLGSPEETPAIIPQAEPFPAKPVEEPAAIIPLQPLFEEKPADAPAVEVDTEWERRAKELNEKLRKFHEEKQELHVQHTEAAEKTKNEFQLKLEEEMKTKHEYQKKLEEEMRAKDEYQKKLEEEKRAKDEYQKKLEEEIRVKDEYQKKLEEEKKRNDEIARLAQESLQKGAEKHEALTRDGDEWRSRAESLGGKVNELETHLVQKASTVEQMMQQIEEEKKKSEETAKKAAEELQKEADRREALMREGDEWRAKAASLDEKVRELETNLMQKATTVEQMAQQVEAERKKSGEGAKAYEDLQKELQRHEALVREGDEWKSKAAALHEKVRELETNLTHKSSAVEQLIQQKDDISQKSERVVSETQREISTLRNREEELSRKVEALEGDLREMTESLKFRDNALAQFEKQIMELAEKAQGYESMRQEHAQLARERATIRQEYDAKLVDQEVRLAKYEEEHRRYRSRVDRKNAAAARELGEWIRGIDTVRQGLQKLILFLGSEAVVLDSEKKSNLKSPLTRGPDSPTFDMD